MSQENLNLTHAESLLFNEHFFLRLLFKMTLKLEDRNVWSTHLICSVTAAALSHNLIQQRTADTQ